MILRLMQKHGHRPMCFWAEAQLLIGDPSGKDSTRKIYSKKQIKKILIVLKKYLKNTLIQAKT